MRSEKLSELNTHVFSATLEVSILNLLRLITISEQKQN